MPPDPFWDWALEQLIVGTDKSLTNSALYGSKYSLLANMLGTPNARSDVGIKSRLRRPHLAVECAAVIRRATVRRGGDHADRDGEFNSTPARLEFGFDVNQNGVFDGSADRAGLADVRDELLSGGRLAAGRGGTVFQ